MPFLSGARNPVFFYFSNGVPEPVGGIFTSWGLPSRALATRPELRKLPRNRQVGRLCKFQGFEASRVVVYIADFAKVRILGKCLPDLGEPLGLKSENLSPRRRGISKT